MNGSEQARNVLRWLDHATPAVYEEARKSCRGRRDVEKLRTTLRQRGWDPDVVAVMTEAAQHKDLEFLVGFMWMRSNQSVIVHRRRAVLR